MKPIKSKISLLAGLALFAGAGVTAHAQYCASSTQTYAPVVVHPVVQPSCSAATISVPVYSNHGSSCAVQSRTTVYTRPVVTSSCGQTAVYTRPPVVYTRPVVPVVVRQRTHYTTSRSCR